MLITRNRLTCEEPFGWLRLLSMSVSMMMQVVGSRGQRPPFSSSVRVSSFSFWGNLPFLTSCCSPVHCFLSLLGGLTPVQLKISSSQLTSLLSQSVQVHAMSVPHVLRPVIHGFSSRSAQFEEWGETDSQSVYSACVFLYLLYTTPDQSSLR